MWNKVRAIDSHTAGEPTRTIVSGGPDLGGGTVSEKLARFRESHDVFRSAVVNEPRGSDILVGALLCEPQNKSSAAGVIFFNNVGYLGMCGHGLIGVVATLAHLGKIAPGVHNFETSVGTVSATLHQDGRVSIRNVPSYRIKKNLEINVPGEGLLKGDIAWGGNWFFLIENHGQDLSFSNVERLTEFCWQVREALVKAGITGEDGAEIDHIELFGAPHAPNETGAHSRNFVLCPGKAYDRSPCGTGTSAKLACLFSDGKLRPGEIWRQESICGTVFEGSVEACENGRAIPTVTGSAYITAELDLIFDPRDPCRTGLHA